MINNLYITVIFLWLSHYLVDVMIGFWAIYKTMAGLDLALAGFISACCAMAGEGMQIYFGSLSDKGYRTVLIVGGLVVSSASAFLAYTDNYVLLAFLFFLTCLGSGAFHPGAVSLMSQLSLKRKGLLITLFASGGALGIATSHLILSQGFYILHGHTGLLVIPFLLVALGMAWYGLPAPASTELKGHSFIDWKTLSSFFRRSDLRALYITQVSNQTMMWSLIFLLPDILTWRNYDDSIRLGGGHLFFVLGSAMMMVPAGYLADKYTSRSVILFSTVLSLVLLYTFLFLPSLPTASLLTLLFFLGASVGVVNPVSVAFGNRLAPENPGLVSAFLMGLVWCVAEGIGQAGGGLLTKLFVEDAPAKALGIVGLILFVGWAAAMKLPTYDVLAIPPKKAE